MDEHIAVLNEYAAKEQEKLSIRKRISGYKLMKTIYHWIGNYFNLSTVSLISTMKTLFSFFPMKLLSILTFSSHIEFSKLKLII